MSLRQLTEVTTDESNGTDRSGTEVRVRPGL